jgi:hypothetical protein
MQLPILACSKRELDKLQYKDEPNKETHNSQQKVWNYCRQTSFHSIDYLSALTIYLSAQFFSKEQKRLLILKNYCFNDSMGTAHQIFMITLPKIEVYSLTFQSNYF